MNARPRELTLFSLVLALGVLVLGSVVFGWTSPGQNPPDGNVSAPINTGGTSQTKSGNLTVSQLTANIASGTAPLVVSSPTKVANLNADLLDGLDASGFGDATLSNQNTLLTRIGTSTDAASIDGSVMAGLQYLWDNRTSFGDSNVLTRIGASSDGASLDSTLFAGQQYLWDNRASFGASITEHRPSNWTCTVRTASGGSGSATASCSGSEKAVAGGCSGSYTRNNGLQSGQNWSCECGSGCGSFTVYVNCCQ